MFNLSAVQATSMAAKLVCSILRCPKMPISAVRNVSSTFLLSRIVNLIPLISAKSALPPVIGSWRYISILWRKLVSVIAVSLLRVYGLWSSSTQAIYARWDSFKMSRIHAMTNSAKMIALQFYGYDFHKKLIGYTVCISSRFSIPEAGIASIIDVVGPQPARCVIPSYGRIDVDFAKEPLKQLTRNWKSGRIVSGHRCLPTGDGDFGWGRTGILPCLY